MANIYFSSSTGCGIPRQGFERILKSACEDYVKTTNPFNADIIVQYFCILSKDCLNTVADVMAFLKQFKNYKPECKIIVGGCAETVIDFKKIYPFIDGAFDKFEMVPQVLSMLGKEEKKNIISMPIENRRAEILVSSGCNRHCSFCKKGYMPMEYHSVPMEEILYQVRYATENRVRYLALVGENLTEYGIDLYQKRMIVELLKEILNVGKFIKGITLGGIVIEEMTPELIELIAKEPRIHTVQLEIQSLIPEVRKAMNIDPSIDKVLRVMDRLSNKAILSNIMVGHPGETESGFKKQLELVKKHNLYFIQVNKFDNTPGTKSYEMEQIPDKIVERRIMELAKVVVQLRSKKVLQLMGESKVSSGKLMSIKGLVTKITSNYIEVNPLEVSAIVRIPRNTLKTSPRMFDVVQTIITGCESVVAGGYQLMILKGELYE